MHLPSILSTSLLALLTLTTPTLALPTSSAGDKSPESLGSAQPQPQPQPQQQQQPPQQALTTQDKFCKVGYSDTECAMGCAGGHCLPVFGAPVGERFHCIRCDNELKR